MGSVFKGNNLLVEIVPYKSCLLLGRESERNSRVAYPESIPIPGCQVFLFFLFFPIFFRSPIFSYILTPFPIFFTKFLYFSKCCRLSALMFNTNKFVLKSVSVY